MEHLRSIATTYYSASSDEAKRKVDKFMKALDKDGDGSVDYYEFKQYLKEQGYEEYANSDLFKKLDKNGDKGLDYWEVMTLYYIIISGRPFCTSCEMFILAEFFVCVECFESSRAPLYFCTHCFKKSDMKHSHNNKNALFLDTYALLESQRMSALAKFTTSLHSPSPPSTSLAIVPSGTTTIVKRSFKAFEIGLSLVSLKVGLLSLGIHSCTIM